MFKDVNEIYESDRKLQKEDVGKLLDWVEKQAHLPKITELQAIICLHSCYYRVEPAKNVLDNYFTMKTMWKELFQMRNIENQTLQISLKTSLSTVLPKLTPKGYTVVYSRLIDPNPAVFNYASSINIVDMCLMSHVYKNGPPDGVVFVCDMKGGAIGHLLKTNVNTIKNSLDFLQTGAFIRLKEYHFINVVPFMDKIMTLIKPFISKEFLEKIFIHSSFDSFYTHVPQEILPKDLGGSEESLQYFLEKQQRTFIEDTELYASEASQTVDESKRTNTNPIFGTEGSFKKLEFD